MFELVVEYSYGDGPMRKFWLRSGDTVRVGGTDWADYTVEWDQDMSPVHFSVHHAGNRAVLRDLNSRNGTYRNNQPITECNLRHGDTIRAGSTEFHAILSDRLQGGPIATPTSEINDQGRRDDESQTLAYEYQLQANGLTSISSDDPTAKMIVVDCLMKRMTVAALINTNALSAMTMSDMSWVVRASQLDESMLMLPFQSVTDISLLDDLWGRDNCVVAASETDLGSFKGKIRSNISAFYRSRIARAQLTQAPAVYVDLLMSGAKAIMVEKENGAGWHLFANTDSERPWEVLGCPPPSAVIA